MTFAPAMTHLALHVRDVGACVDFYRDYCGMKIVSDRRDADTGLRVAWIAEVAKQKDFIIVLISGGPGRERMDEDLSHLGFALESRAAVDAAAGKARADGRLVWEPRDAPYPVGYYCGVREPDGNTVEFSYGQPLGPGADT